MPLHQDVTKKNFSFFGSSSFLWPPCLSCKSTRLVTDTC